MVELYIFLFSLCVAYYIVICFLAIYSLKKIELKFFKEMKKLKIKNMIFLKDKIYYKGNIIDKNKIYFKHGYSIKHCQNIDLLKLLLKNY